MNGCREEDQEDQEAQEDQEDQENQEADSILWVESGSGLKAGILPRRANLSEE